MSAANEADFVAEFFVHKTRCKFIQLVKMMLTKSLLRPKSPEVFYSFFWFYYGVCSSSRRRRHLLVKLKGMEY